MPQLPSFYTWRSCSTCRDAKKFLDALGVEVDERDFFQDNLSREELTRLVSTIGIENLFSWRSPSAKPYRERRDTVTTDELVNAMFDEPRLIRRPIITAPDTEPIVGFNKSAYAELET